jgi:DNA recombination protein RmuC
MTALLAVLVVAAIVALIYLVNSVHLNTARLTDRLSALEQQQGAVRDSTSGLREAAESIRTELGRAQVGLTSLQAQATARQDMERATSESIRRLEAVIAGTAAKGGAGENIIDLVFAKLPVEWQVRDFTLGNRHVEFGLKLPNGRIVPIDSKWPATNLLELFLASTDPAERQALKAQIEAAVVAKVREVTKYLDPELTANFGIAVVPDAVYDLCGAAQVQAMQMRVVLVGYGMFVPYLLLVFQTALANSRDIDLERLGAYLVTLDEAVSTMQGEVEGRLSRAITMLDNSRDDLRAQVAKVGNVLAQIRPHSAPAALRGGTDETPD